MLDVQHLLKPHGAFRILLLAADLKVGTCREFSSGTRPLGSVTVSPPALTSGAAACFGQTRISVGKASTRLTYVDQVLQLVYEEGSPCPSKSGLRYKSVISFVCRPEARPTNRPMLISLDKQTCTLFFSWHTPLACEQVVSCQSTCGI